MQRQTIVLFLLIFFIAMLIAVTAGGWYSLNDHSAQIKRIEEEQFFVGKKLSKLKDELQGMEAQLKTNAQDLRNIQDSLEVSLKQDEEIASKIKLLKEWQNRYEDIIKKVSGIEESLLIQDEPLVEVELGEVAVEKSASSKQPPSLE